MSRFWVHHLQCPHFPSASHLAKRETKGQERTPFITYPCALLIWGQKMPSWSFEGRRWWCFSDWICILRMRDFFCSNRTLSVSVVWVLFVHDDNQVLAPWPTIWGIYRERERACSYNYIHIYTMQYRRINSLFIWIWHHIFVQISGVHCPWTAYAHFSMALPFCIYKL